MHSFTASPDGISSLPIAINVSLNSNIMTHNPTTYSPSTPILSSILTSRSFQTHPSILLTPISNPYNTSLYSPFSSNSFPQTGPSVFPGPSSIFPCLRSSFAITGSIPSPSLSSTVTPCTLPTSFSFQQSPTKLWTSSFQEVILRLPELPFLGEGELPGAGEDKLLPLPAVRHLPFPATIGLVFNPTESFLEVLLLMAHWTQLLCPELIIISPPVFL